MIKHFYYFDLWAEYLTVTLAENINRCDLIQPVKKVRITLSNEANWPVKFKVILDNELIAVNPNKPTDQDGNHDIEYFYQSPSSIPFGKNILDTTSEQFINKVRTIDPLFLSDAWTLHNPKSIPSLLLNLAFRSVIKLLPFQLQKQGIQVSEQLAIQFFDGSNYLSFSYDAIRHSLLEQSNLYLINNEVSQLAASTCFKHEHNKQWLNALN